MRSRYPVYAKGAGQTVDRRYPVYAGTTSLPHRVAVECETPPMPKRDQRDLIEQALAVEAVEAREANALGYLARVFAQTSLPYRDPGEVLAWGRRNGVL